MQEAAGSSEASIEVPPISPHPELQLIGQITHTTTLPTIQWRETSCSRVEISEKTVTFLWSFLGFP